MIALLVMMVLPDYPNLTSWLSETEQFIAQKRLVDDVGAADEDDSEEGKFTGLKLAVSDPKVWLLGYVQPLMNLKSILTSPASPTFLPSWDCLSVSSFRRSQLHWVSTQPKPCC